MNLNSEISKYIKVGINASGYRGVSNDAWNGFVSVYQGVTREKPTNKVYNEDGSYTYSGVDNPVAIQGDKSGFRRNTQQEINLTGHATIQILPELSIKGVYSVRNYTSNQDGFKKHFTYGSGSNAYDSGLREGYDKYYNHNYYTGQVLINFNKSFGKHNISALAGFESYEHIYKYTEATRQGGGSDELPESLNTLDQSSQKIKTEVMKWLVCLISDVSNMIMQVSICLKLIYVVMPLHVSRKIIVGEYSPHSLQDGEFLKKHLLKTM